EQVGAVHGVDEEQLVPPRFRALDGPPGERGREEHVVEGDRAAPPLAVVLARRQQDLGARVGDDDAALGVGQEDRVGHRVDDVVEQRPLAEAAPLALLAALGGPQRGQARAEQARDRKSTRLNSSHVAISYAVFCLKKKKNKNTTTN